MTPDQTTNKAAAMVVNSWTQILKCLAIRIPNPYCRLRGYFIMVLAGETGGSERAHY
jgi:hypothetical protein